MLVGTFFQIKMRLGLETKIGLFERRLATHPRRNDSLTFFP